MAVAPSGFAPTAPRDRTVARVRHELRLRLLEVVAVRRVTPRLVRVTLGGEALAGFVSLGFDDHVKVFVPAEGQAFDRAPELGPSGPIFPDGAPRPAMRDYTPHDFDPAGRTLQLDFALHDAGPATAWAQAARPGDRLVVGGPRGSFVVGDGYDWRLLIGDETALPAIRRCLAELPPTARAIVFAEVDGPDDEEPFATAADVEIHWVHRRDARLQDAVAAAPLPPGDGYAWVACESADAKALRETLLARGLDRRALKASGYWRRGAAASHDVHD
jgi:NADPH-dependent ferric siderophore reductase